jgi:hypothetical protein
MKLQTFIYLILVAIVSNGCRKADNETVDMYLKVPVTVTPSADTIKLGDTLYINILTSKTMYEHYSKQYYTMPASFKFNTNILISRLVSPDKDIIDQPGGVSAFTFINSIGRIGNPSGRFGNIFYTESADSFKCRIGMIPNQTGVFAFSLFYNPAPNGIGSTYRPDIDLGTTPSGGKRIPDLRGILYYINNGNMHYPIYRTHCKPRYPLPATPWKDSMTHYLSDSLQNYTFVVR